jgi:catechol 2,3-dioxygenase-like lactoylglutathione lyase family enzyme
MDMKLELVAVPVTDVDRAIEFYRDKVGFHLDHDTTVNAELRFVQLTPPGSACSIVTGKGVTEMAPGSQKGLQVVVDDAEAVMNDLRGHGVQTSEIQDAPWGRFVFFSDPDGNSWSIQQIPKSRRPPLP